MAKEYYLGIDTSVLDRLQKFDDYAQNFKNFVTNKNLILLIPNGAAIEFCGRSILDESKKMAVWFSAFLKSFNIKIVLGKDWRFLIRKEMNCLFEKPPILSTKERQKLLHVLEDPQPRQDLIDDFQKRK